MEYSKKLITILGPTAIGKTKFAAQLAYNFNGEIISADSRQVYIGMDIGTGKDYNDYIINKTKVKSHLLDVIKPHCEFNLFLYTQLVKKTLYSIYSQNKLPFMVGGTGLYLSAVLQDYSMNNVDFNSPRYDELNNYSNEELATLLKKLTPSLHNTTDLIEKDRIIKAIMIAENRGEVKNSTENIEHLIIGLTDDRELVKKRIRERLSERLQNGMIEEVRNLIESGVTHQKLRFFGLEYKFISQYLTNELSYNDMQQKLASAIIKFSKRQMTWFRKMEKEGIKINWLKNSEINKAEELIKYFIEK